jgi:hypothetical protein
MCDVIALVYSSCERVSQELASWVFGGASFAFLSKLLKRHDNPVEMPAL